METSRPRITRLHARNFRSLQDVTVDLEDLTVLVGRNAAGKSNSVDALRFLRDSTEEGVERALSLRGGSETVIDGKDGGVEAEIHAPTWRVKILSGISNSDIYSNRFVSLEGEGKWTDIEKYKEAKGSADILKSVASRLKYLISSIENDAEVELYQDGIDHFDAISLARRSISEGRFYDFTPRLLRAPQRVTKPVPLQEDGENLVSALRELISGPDADTLRNTLRSLIDGVENMEVTQAAGHLVAELLYTGVGGEPARFDLGLESDGTIRLVALLAALYQSPPPSLIVIEEPERNIHPGALGILADVIKEASTRGQVLITTHSPDLIDHFDPDTIRVVERVDGATTVGPMDGTQREAVRSKLFSTGELLRMEGLNREEA